MNRTVLAIVAAAVVIGAAVVAQENVPAQPGKATQARVWIENRGEAQAVPVTVTQVAGVRVTGPVTLESSTLVQTHAARQAWEYRTVAIPPESDAASVLKTPGADGWEAAGVLSTAPSVVVLMKRPR